VTVHQKPNTLQTDSFWMPFTANRQFKKAPRLFASAEGMHYTTVDGRKVIDGSAGLWCVNACHGRRQIAAAVERQLMNGYHVQRRGFPVFAFRLHQFISRGDSIGLSVTRRFGGELRRSSPSLFQRTCIDSSSKGNVYSLKVHGLSTPLI
jgi:hypothetical protein